MGICHLCKEQTNLYCVEHQKHVCLKCIIQNHVECTICQYVDYVDGKVKKDNTCHLCDEEIFDGDGVVRTPCLHKFHHACLLKSLESIELNENDSCTGKFICPECSADLFVEENKNNVLMAELISQFKDCPIVKKYVGIIEEIGITPQADGEATSVSLKMNDDEGVVESQNIQVVKKEGEIAIGMNDEQTIELDIEDDDKKSDMKDVDGNSILHSKTVIAWRTRILIIILIICFVLVIKALINQQKMILPQKPQVVTK